VRDGWVATSNEQTLSITLWVGVLLLDVVFLFICCAWCFAEHLCPFVGLLFVVHPLDLRSISLVFLVCQMVSIIAVHEPAYIMKCSSPLLVDPLAAIQTQVLLTLAAVARRLRIITLVARVPQA